MKMIMNGTMAALVGAGMATTALAGSPKPPDDFGDVYVLPVNGVLTTNRLIDLGNDEFTFEPFRCFSAELGEIIPFYADEPGFYSDSLPAGFQLSFDILDSLRMWNGSDFGTIPAETLTLALALGVPGSPEVQTPAVPGVVAGFPFVTADPTGFIDEHMDLFLNVPQGDGVYLLQMRLNDADAALGTSEPFWIVVSNNADKAEFDLAKAYVESVIVPAPGAGALLVGAGLLGLRRRR